MSDDTKLTVNGVPLAPLPGASIAAALTHAGHPCRTSVSGEPRGPLCGMGICFECRAEVNGQPHSRTCQMESDFGSAGCPGRAKSPQSTDRSYDPGNSTNHFDILVVGGGPAGMAAACRGAESGNAVAIVDENPGLGGQIWRGESQKPTDSECQQWLARVRCAGVTTFSGVRVFDQPAPGIVLAEATGEFREFRFKKLILATGARERFLPFPGWTLPNVMGVGGLQAMVKNGLPIAGKRVVVAGTGPLLLAVAAYLGKKGAIVPFICEQTSPGALANFAVALSQHPAKLLQGVQLAHEIAGTTFLTNSWITAAQGGNKLEGVTISRKGVPEDIVCDYLACGFHLVPNTEFAGLLGCQLHDGFVAVDGFQKTTVPDVYCAGEPTAIGGVELSIIEGEIAGFAAAGRDEAARKLFRKRASLRRFARALDHAYSLRSHLRTLVAPDTIVCRCEDISYSRLSQMASWRSAKLQSRCGMGACQGRVCGPATQFLFKWTPESVRPPLFPVPVACMARWNERPISEPRELRGGLP